MLNIQQLSFWERKSYFEEIDFLIIGAGIVGNSTAYHLKKRFKDAKIVIIERGYLPTGASTKNAGFACFGSPTELLDDLSQHSEQEVWNTVSDRYEGLIYLRELLGDSSIDFHQHGSWDLVRENQNETNMLIHEKLDYLNFNLEQITGKQGVFTSDQHSIEKFGFQQLLNLFHNKLEGQIDTGKMMLAYNKLITRKGILQINGIEVLSIYPENKSIRTSVGEICAKNIILTTNGFAKQFINEEVKPARAQVIVTSPIENLKFKGTFHYDSGYYYFRNIGSRILIGGGRNLDFEGEETTVFGNSSLIIDSIQDLLNHVIIPNSKWRIDYQWAGIMGVGNSKKPLIKKINNNFGIAVRLGGMGVAIGTNVGKKAAELFD